MASFQLDTIYLDGLKDLIQNNMDKDLKKQLNDLHYADIAEIIEQLELSQSIYLVKLLDFSLVKSCHLAYHMMLILKGLLILLKLLFSLWFILID